MTPYIVKRVSNYGSKQWAIINARTGRVVRSGDETYYDSQEMAQRILNLRLATMHCVKPEN